MCSTKLNCMEKKWVLACTKQLHTDQQTVRVSEHAETRISADAGVLQFSCIPQCAGQAAAQGCVAQGHFGDQGAVLRP